MQIVIKRCLLKDFSAVLDYLWDIKATTKAILFWVPQIKGGPKLESTWDTFDIGALAFRPPIKFSCEKKDCMGVSLTQLSRLDG